MPRAAPHPSRHDPFEDWARAQLAQQHMKASSIDKYHALWNAWRDWLSSQDIKWHAVNGEVIQRFLKGPAPGQGGRRKALNPLRMSSYTRQRYWRLLRGVYASAVKEQQITQNPALQVPDSKRPSITLNDRQSQILEPAVFALLQVADKRNDLIPAKSPNDWRCVRDRAMMALLVECAVTASEVIALRGMDVRRSGLRDLPLLQITTKQTLMLDVMQTDQFVQRSMPLSEQSAEQLNQWLGIRRQLLQERANAHSANPTAQKAYMAQHDAPGPLFLSGKTRTPGAPLPAMQAVTVYYVVSRIVAALRQAANAGQHSHVASGPAVIRNSVIRHWLDTVGSEETVRRAGLKNQESLRLPSKPKMHPPS